MLLIVHITRQRSDLPELNLGLQACQGAGLPAACARASAHHSQMEGAATCCCLCLTGVTGASCYMLPAGITSNNTIELCRQALEVRPWPHHDFAHKIQGACNHPSIQLGLCMPLEGHVAHARSNLRERGHAVGATRGEMWVSWVSCLHNESQLPLQAVCCRPEDIWCTWAVCRLQGQSSKVSLPGTVSTEQAYRLSAAQYSQWWSAYSLSLWVKIALLCFLAGATGQVWAHC